LRKLCASLLFCSLLLAAFTVSCKATNTNEVSSKISEAENALTHAFTTVWKAEKIGANVSSLVDDLSRARELLDEAEIAYANEDLDSALNKADQSLTTANNVLGHAKSLNDLASAEAQRSFWLTFAFSSVGAVLFIIALILVWVWVNRLYAKKMLKMKPEVTKR
jgi:hypothetical protein